MQFLTNWGKVVGQMPMRQMCTSTVFSHQAKNIAFERDDLHARNTNEVLTENRQVGTELSPEIQARLARAVVLSQPTLVSVKQTAETPCPWKYNSYD